MRNFAIVTDSSSDLTNLNRNKYNIDYIPMHMICDGVDYTADLDWKKLSVKEFYDMMRAGKRFITSQINVTEYKEKFIEYAKQGLDVLSISCSSALSASIKASMIAREEVMKEYPDCNIVCVDSLRGCMGQGIICIKASELRAQGKTIEEVKDWIEKNRSTSHQEGTVDTLKYFRQAGRVSAMSAFFGGLLSIKPMITSDAIGQNVALEKVKGKKAALNRMVERFCEGYIPELNNAIYVGHGDAIEDALALKEMLKPHVGENVEIVVGDIGPIIGATAGPGTITLHFFGKEITYIHKVD